MNDTISLHNMIFIGRHGVYDFEQEYGQRFEVDLDLVTDFSQAISTDCLEQALDYVAIYNDVKQIVETQHYQLLESLCAKITEAVLSYAEVQQVTVKVRKPAAAIGGALDYVQVSRIGSK